jgi:hypothetical protein
VSLVEQEMITLLMKHVDQYKHDISIQNIVERRTPSWSLSDNTGKTALKDLEEKYLKFVSCTCCTTGVTCGAGNDYPSYETRTYVFI